MRILKNICGMWLLQDAVVSGTKGKTNSYGQPIDWEDMNIRRLTPSRSLRYRSDASEFAKPGNMPQIICDFAKRTGQVVPKTDGAVLRTIVESLALKFRHVLTMCEAIGGKHIETIHIVGGGVKNKLLLQATADATGRRVVGGPIEGTGIGNVLMQMIGAGDVSGVEEAREIVRNSFDVVTFEPFGSEAAAWDEAYERFLTILPQ